MLIAVKDSADEIKRQLVDIGELFTEVCLYRRIENRMYLRKIMDMLLKQ